MAPDTSAHQFKIKWYNRKIKDFQMTEGLSRYPIYEAAARQVKEWQAIFPSLTYFIEPI
jgi:hypothetical protein